MPAAVVDDDAIAGRRVNSLSAGRQVCVQANIDGGLLKGALEQCLALC
jgi:hypothetical protein